MNRIVTPHGESMVDDLPTAIGEARRYAERNGLEALITTGAGETRLLVVGPRTYVSLAPQIVARELQGANR